MRNHKVHLIILSAFLLCLLCLGMFGYWIVYSPFASHAEHTYIYIDKNDNIDSVFTKIEQVAHPRQMMGLKLVSHLLQYDQKVKTGKYEVGNGLTALEIIRNLRNKNQVPVRLTVPNVRTMEQLVSRLSKVIAPDSTALITTFRDSTVCHQFGFEKETLSCLFIPNTYEVYWDITPLQLLKKMDKESKIFWNDERLKKAQAQALSPIEVITLASIVDQETANNEEKPSIAGMYLNRLRKGMLLQADPTVKFALQKFGLRRILHEHLKIDSPYNTYRNLGLPPGPIAIPAVSSIDAVLNAEKSDYLFMCAKEDFSGRHNFACSYSEHLRNARKYTRALNQRGIK